MPSKKIEELLGDKTPLCDKQNCEQRGRHHKCYDGSYATCEMYGYKAIGRGESKTN